MITQMDLYARVTGLGLTLRFVAGEYRVAHPISHYRAKYPAFPTALLAAKQEEGAYYSTDRDDAYATAIKMAEEAKT